MVCKMSLLARGLAGVALSVAALNGGVAQALETAPTSTPLPAAAPPSTPASSVPVAAPPAGSVKLIIQRAHDSKAPFALLGERILVRGSVVPYVAGQKILLDIYRDGRRVFSRQIGVSAVGNGAGQFHIAYASPRTGMVSVRAEHAATPQLDAFAAKAVSVRYEPSTIGVGARGPAVLFLQDKLAHLHYEIPVSGFFDEATGRAVLAFRKVIGLQRIESANAHVYQLLQRGAGSFHVRYPGDGNHVEADLSKQVLVEVERGGRVRRIYTMSSGKPSTPTVLGRFRVYSKTTGTNSEGMVDSNYFIRGYAIHGYAEVPPYAASHGCLRIPIPNAPAVFGWVQLGYPVDVYTDDGRGSRVLRSNAGP
jgi:peptidoglycan hydrolase-like protein with peptidoglycan-binding domain